MRQSVKNRATYLPTFAVTALALLAMPAVAGADSEQQARSSAGTVEVLIGTKGVEALVGAVLYVENAGVLDFSLVEFLNSPRNRFILFAPTNSAFENLLGLAPGSLDGLSAADIANALGGFVAADAVAGILLKHVVASRPLGWGASESGLLRAGSATAADGSSLEIGVGAAGVTVNNATIVKADFRSRNSVIHFIDTVL